MKETSTRICRRCLLRDMAERDSYANLYTYLNSLSSDDKVPDAVYEERLAVCRTCDKLLSGMCVLCGCYVELRAAMRVRGCPHVPAKWGPCVCCDTERT
ncbi:MAG: DUF6171 family protein [Lachnospiraceae bacterium]|nr:DUF6171 family protein [Lachnospiraceae bacterium]MCD7766633.1 DUF6171 family protein [Lachnospiraceae bacterium]